MHLHRAGHASRRRRASAPRACPRRWPRRTWTRAAVPRGYCRRRQQPLQRIERHVEIARARPARADPRSESRISSRCLLIHTSRSGTSCGRCGRRPRRHDGAHQVAGRVAELGLVVRPRALLGDEPLQQLSLEPRPRQRAPPGAHLRQRRGERGDLLGGFVERAGARAEGEEVERRPADHRRRVLRQDRLHPHPLEHVVGPEVPRSRAPPAADPPPPSSRWPSSSDVGQLRSPAPAPPPASAPPARRAQPHRHARRRARRRQQRARDGGGAAPPHSPITFTMSRLSRWPSNSA